MKHGATVYVFFAVCLAVGLWLILGAGQHLHAPPDLQGQWSLENGQSLKIDQSGEFFEIDLPDAGRLNLRLISRNQVRSGESTLTRLELDGDQHHLTIDSIPDSKSCRFTLHGPHNGQWSGQRSGDAAPPLRSRPSAPKAGGSPESISPIFLLLMQVILILGLGRVMGMLFSRIRQPNVVGEMIAGIILGPSLLGWLFPTAAVVIFPAESVKYLNVLSQIGVIFFLFLVGLELDPKLIRNRGQAAVVISHASIIAPFLLGAGITLILYTRVFNDAPHMKFTPVALFMGAAMSITAFPVLARILTERNLHKTKVGAVSITCAAVDDVTAWCMLAFVVAIARLEGLKPGLFTAGASIVYVLTMFFFVRPFLRRLEGIYERQGRLSQTIVAVVFLLTLTSAVVTEFIGIHALFGAFLMGAMMPKGTLFVRTLSEKLEDFTTVFLLPIFFAYTGLQTRIGLLNTPYLWGMTGLIILVACLGKFGGSTVAAKACGLGWRESSAIGILMNTRGLMELVILTIGLQLGVITHAVFAMMVIMALVTTALTTPILHWVYPPKLFRQEGAVVDEATAEKEFGVLVPVSLPSTGPALARMAELMSTRDNAARKIYALHLTRPVDYDAYRVSVEQSPNGTPEALAPLLLEAKKLNMQTEALTFVSRDVPSDISRVARNKKVDLILMGFHNPVFTRTILGGAVHRVLTGSDNNVAIFVDRNLTGLNQILVPYLGGPHDVLALQLAARIAVNSGATIRVLGVAATDNSTSDAAHNPIAVAEAVSKLLIGKVSLQETSIDSPIDAVIERAKESQLIVIGVAEEWGLESQLFGMRPERIAEATEVSLLIVRKA